MDAREEILTRLHNQAREVSSPAPWRSRRSFEDLADQFTQALTAAKGEVHRAKSFKEALNLVGDLFEELNIRTVLVDSQPLLETADFPNRWPGVEWHIAGKTEGDLREFAAAADIGIGGASAALAETGTVVVNSGPGRSRLTGLLPPIHLALVPTSCLTSDIFSWTAARQGDLPSSTTLISGPSKTADIEQTMAIGVHGPKRFIVVLYED